jgi:hypothetical protein
MLAKILGAKVRLDAVTRQTDACGSAVHKEHLPPINIPLRDMPMLNGSSWQVSQPEIQATSSLSSILARIWTLPIPTAFTNPEPETVATAGLLEVQVTGTPTMVRPAESLANAVN